MRAFLILAAILLQGCTYVDVEVGGDVSATCTIPFPMPLPFMGPPRPASRDLFREGFYAAGYSYLKLKEN